MADISPQDAAPARPPYTAVRGLDHAGARLKADPRAAGVIVAWDALTGLALIGAALAVTGLGGADWLIHAVSLAVFVRHILSETAWQRFLLGAPQGGWRAYRFGAQEWRAGLALVGTGIVVGLVLAGPVMLTAFIFDVLDIGGLALWIPIIILFGGLLILLPRLSTVVSLSVLRGRVAIFQDIAETASIWGSLILAAIALSVGVVLICAVAMTPFAVALGDYEAAGALLDSVEWLNPPWPPTLLELSALGISSVLSALIWLIGRGVGARAALDLEAAEAN